MEHLLFDALIAAHGEEPKLMPFLHLPVQSGSDRVLAAVSAQRDDIGGRVAQLTAERDALAAQRRAADEFADRPEIAEDLAELDALYPGPEKVALF